MKRTLIPFHWNVPCLCGPGERAQDIAPGDMLLVRSKGFVGAGIRAAERLRVGKEWSWCNHACIVIEALPDAYVAQMDAHGEVLTPLSKLDASYYAVLRAAVDPLLVNNATLFASDKLGCGYGFLQIVADLFNATTGCEVTLGWGDRMVCSTQSTRTWERYGYVPRLSAYAQTPAHLARDFGVSRSYWQAHHPDDVP